MKLYLYRIGDKTPMLEMENVASYTGDQVVAEDGTIYGPLAEGCELSSLPDCSEALRADWRREHPTAEKRLEELEELMASLLFGGGAGNGGEAE